MGLRSSDFRSLGTAYLYVSDTEYRPYSRSWSRRLPIFRLSRFVKLDIRSEYAGEPRGLLQRIAQLGAVILAGKPSSLLRLADMILNHNGLGEFPIRPRVVVTGAEQLFPAARERLGMIFGCPVFDAYGMTEVGMIACECSVRQGLHVEDDHVIVEIVRDGQPVPPGQSGEIVVTCLDNPTMPILRYRTGDSGRLLVGNCPCGLAYPRLAGLEGRLVDQFLTSAGDKFNPFVLLGRLPELGLEQFELVQRSLNEVLVRYVGNIAASDVCAAVHGPVRDHMGAEVTVRAERVDTLTSPTGKPRLYRCEVSDSDLK